MATYSVREGPKHMTSTWKKDFFSFCVCLPVFFLFCYLHFLVLFLGFWFIGIFSIRLLLSAFFHPHPPSAGIRSAFYRHPFSLCAFVRFETMIWPSIRFYISLQSSKKPLDIFSPQIERKRSKEYLVIILAVKESFERFSFLEFICEKSKHWEAGLKHKLKLISLIELGDSGILETL